MANIAVITLDKTHNSIPPITSALSAGGHQVTEFNTSEIEGVDLTTFDLLTCARMPTNEPDSLVLVLQAFNLGVPILGGTIGGAVAGTETFNEIGVLAGLYNSHMAMSSEGQHIILTSDHADMFYSGYGKPFRAYLNISFRYTFNTPFCDGAKVIAYDQDNTDSTYSSVTMIAFEKGSINLFTNPLPARYIANGYLYGTGGFTNGQKQAMLNMVDWLTDPLLNTLNISGVVKLEGQPIKSKVISISNDVNNPVILGVTDSDPITGYYEFQTPYDKPVMVFTMQNYGEAWATEVTLAEGDSVHPTVDNGYFYKVTQAGTTGATEPVWPTEAGLTVTDGSITYTSELLLEPQIAGYKTPTPII